MQSTYLTANKPQSAATADLVVYLRLGDKSTAGDTLLTFQSGFYDIVLTQRRAYARSCVIVTVCVM